MKLLLLPVGAPTPRTDKDSSHHANGSLFGQFLTPEDAAKQANMKTTNRWRKISQHVGLNKSNSNDSEYTARCVII